MWSCFDQPQRRYRKRPTDERTLEMMRRFEDPFPGILVEDPPTDFPVVLRKVHPDDSTNLDVDISDGITLQVREVMEGPATEWNRKFGAALHRDIRVFDRIYEVNGLRGDASVLLEACRNTTLELLVRRAKQFQLQLEKPRLNYPLGMTVARAMFQNRGGSQGSVDALIVEGLCKDSLVGDYNKVNWENPIRKGDRIIAVNGLRGTAEQLMKAMTGDRALELVVEH